MANVGSLARIALPEVLETIALHELSGCLEVTSGRAVRTHLLRPGTIVFTASNSESDRLGHASSKPEKSRRRSSSSPRA